MIGQRDLVSIYADIDFKVSKALTDNLEMIKRKFHPIILYDHQMPDIGETEMESF